MPLHKQNKHISRRDVSVCAFCGPWYRSIDSEQVADRYYQIAIDFHLNLDIIKGVL